VDILRPIIKHIAYDYFLRRDGLKVAPHRKVLRASQYLSEDELMSLQLKEMKRLIAYCYGNNRFYYNRFESYGFHPYDLKDLSVLKKLPILTKDDIRKASDQLFSKGFTPENTVHKRTGGSTGVPLHVYWDFDAAGFKRAGALRHNVWAGLVPSIRTACVWGDTDKPTPLKVRIRNMLTERVFYLDTLKFDDRHIESFIKKIHRYRPQILMGHAHSVYRLAEYVRDHNIGDLAFNGIITSAMVLTKRERKAIEEAFRSPVFNRYGCEEMGIIASECENHQGMHVFAEGLYLELLGDDENLPRKLIITDLLNCAMPLIRYEIGDFAVALPGKCPCGRTLPRLKEVSGRTADFLYTPDGKPVFGISILDTFVIHIPGFKQVQIIQNRYDRLDFNIVKDDKFSEESMARLKRNVIEIFGDKMRYAVNFVDSIKQTKQGKFRFSICNIDKDRNDRMLLENGGSAG
jgi:phenylacetate-CoA ligase